MKVFDQYGTTEPITVRGTYGRVIVVIPAGTRGCINGMPTNRYPDPCFECIYEEQWYSTRVKKDLLAPQKGNAQVQRLMALRPAIDYCLSHTKHNIGWEVSSENSALSAFFSQVYAQRFLQPVEMKQALGAIRQDTSFQDRYDAWYGGSGDDRYRITYEVSLGHYEYLLRLLDEFLATGFLQKQLCWFLLAHQEPVMRDETVPCPETATQMAYRVAQEQAAILVAQEKGQVRPYPFLYAAFIISERMRYELLQAWYNYRHISYREQERIAKESLVAAGYSDIVSHSLSLFE